MVRRDGLCAHHPYHLRVPAFQLSHPDRLHDGHRRRGLRRHRPAGRQVRPQAHLEPLRHHHHHQPVPAHVHGFHPHAAVHRLVRGLLRHGHHARLQGLHRRTVSDRTARRRHRLGEAVSRVVGGVLATYYLAFFLSVGGVKGVFTFMAVAFAIAIIALWIWGQETARRSVEDTSAAPQK